MEQIWSMGAFLGIVAGVCNVLAYNDYNKGVSSGGTEPNSTTWLIWTPLAYLSASSYMVMTADWVKLCSSFANVTFCTATFVVLLRHKKFKWPSPYEMCALAIGVISVVAWMEYKSAACANLIMQFAILSGFIPTYLNVWRVPTAERFRPWVIWVITYFFLLATIIVRWDGHWEPLVYPINMIVLHTIVPTLAIYSARRVKAPIVETV